MAAVRRVLPLYVVGVYLPGQRADFPGSLAVPLPEGIRIHLLLTPAFTGPVLVWCACCSSPSACCWRSAMRRASAARCSDHLVSVGVLAAQPLTTLVAFSKVMLKARAGVRVDQPRSGHWEDQRMTDVLIYSERGLLPRVVDSLLTLFARCGFLYLFSRGLISVMDQHGWVLPCRCWR